jgi:hypothetical protein
VSFELGRPLGVPNDAAFQRRVLLAALKLLEAPRGPVLQDFPEDAPSVSDVSPLWACPVNLNAREALLSDTESFTSGLKQETTQLRSWYDLSVRKRGRTTFGVSGLQLDAICEFLIAFLGEGVLKNPRGDLPLGLILKLAADDLKTYYFEAVTTQPGQGSATSDQVAEWFWGETVAAHVLLGVKQACQKSDDPMVRAVGEKLLVPMTQANRDIPSR